MTVPSPVAQPNRIPPGNLRVLLVNQAFWPDVTATAQHAHDLARHMTAAGVDVAVIASRSLYGKSGEALASEEVVDGIRVVRPMRSAFDKRHMLGRAFDFLAFYAAAAIRALGLPRFHVVVCFTTPPFISTVGLLQKWLRGSRFVIWVMDLYPDVPVAAGVLRRNSLTHRLCTALDRLCMRHADSVVVLGACMRERVLRRGIDPDKIKTINVWSDPEEVQNAPEGARKLREEWGIGARFVVEYAGNFGIGHDHEALFGGMRECSDQKDLCWLIVGGGKRRQALEDFVAGERISNVLFKPYQPRTRLGALLGAGDVHLVTMRQEFEGLMVPSKFYGILAAARPVVFVGPEGSEVARVIRERECGLIVPPGDGHALSAALQHLQSNPETGRRMGLRGHQAMIDQFQARIACDAWLQLLRQVSSQP